MSMLEKLRETILAKKISGAELCRKTGVQEGSLSKFLSGKGGLNAESFEALAAAVGLDLVDREHTSIFEDERVRHGRIAFATRDNAAFVADLIPSQNTIDAAALIAGETGNTIGDVLTAELANRCADELHEAGILPAMLKSNPDMVLRFWNLYRRATLGAKGHRLIATSRGFIPCGPGAEDTARAETWLATVVEETGGYVDEHGKPLKTPRKK